MKRSKIILSTYLLAISFTIATFSMSIAWYATSARLRIEEFEITIDCDRQLAISTDAEKGYKASLDNDDLNNVGLFTPVTSAHQSNWLYKKDMPIFYNDTTYSEEENEILTTEVNSGFLSQKLYLKSDDNVYVTINPDETYIKPNTEYNKIYAEKLYEQYQIDNDEYKRNLSKEDIENRLNTLVKAMRYSILVNSEEDYQYVIIDPNKEETTLYGGLLDINVDRYYDSYVSNKDGLRYERLYGEYNDKKYIVYDDDVSQTDSDYENVNEEPNAFNARHNKGTRKINFEKSKELKIKEEESISLTDFKAKKKPFHFIVRKDKPTEIVLSIYIEGWDLDSINYTMGATFISDLALVIESEAVL